MRYWIVLGLWCSTLFSDSPPTTVVEYGEDDIWFTGPLIAQSAVIVPIGHVNIEPYFSATAITGSYDGDGDTQKVATLWNFNLEPQLIFGLTKKIDVYVLPSFYFNSSGGKTSWAIGDLIFGVDFQLYQDIYLKYDWYPSVKLFIYETFPTGTYDRLDPKKNLTQVGGAGSYTTQLGLVFGKLFHFSSYYFLTSRLQLTYSLPSPVKVKGFSLYGGGFDTNGTVYPAQNFNADLAFEISLSRNWAFALDLIGQWSGKIRFKGNPGTSSDGVLAKLNLGSGFQYSLAPAIEYNWNENLGIILGSWFTFAGKNSVQFYSGLFAINYYI